MSSPPEAGVNPSPVSGSVLEYHRMLNIGGFDSQATMITPVPAVALVCFLMVEPHVPLARWCLMTATRAAATTPRPFL
jgi:hypothetical protein